jgi:hypothetical protein
MNPSVPSTNPARITRSMAAVSIGVFLAMSAGDHALAWGSGGGGGGGGGGQTRGLDFAKPILLTVEDRDSLNHALRDADAIRTARATSPGGAKSALVAEVQKILADLKNKGYDADPEYVSKVVSKVERIKNAMEGADAPGAAKTM